MKTFTWLLIGIIIVGLLMLTACTPVNTCNDGCKYDSAVYAQHRCCDKPPCLLTPTDCKKLNSCYMSCYGYNMPCYSRCVNAYKYCYSYTYVKQRKNYWYSRDSAK